jgi:PAS domain S-box-containing protein
MVTLAWGVIWVTLAIGTVVYAGVGLRTSRREKFPGRLSFVVYCLLVAIALLCFTTNTVIGFLVSRDGAGSLPEAILLGDILVRLVAFSTALLAPLAWFRFTLVYTGQRIPTTRRMILFVGFPVIVTLAGLLVWASLPFVSILLDWNALQNGVGDVFVAGLGYLLRVTGFYLASLLLVGAALLGWTNYTYRHLSTRGGVLFGAGCILPLMAMAIPFIAELFERLLVHSAHVAAGTVIGVVALGTAIVRYDVFESVPAAGTIGRTVTVEEMNDPVVVVDEDHQIVDMNPAVERLFDVSVDAVGKPLSHLCGESVDASQLLAAEHYEFETETQRVIEAVGSTLEDEYSRPLGHSIVFHDVTERNRREQRIQVLNRVLRHNLRNDMAVVKANAETLEGMAVELQQYPEQIQQTADGLLETGKKARDIERLVATRDGKSAPLSTVLEDVVTEVRNEYPNCTFEIESPVESRQVKAEITAAVLRELLRNGARHNDSESPVVEVKSRRTNGDRDFLELTVTDNGPGIPDHELAPLREGAETELEHGSGLGLWLVEWGVATVGGEIAFEQSEASGTTAILRLPESA